MKNNIWILIIIFCLSYYFFAENTINAQDDLQCKEMIEEIKKLINVCQECKNDNECFVDGEIILGCPFGCYFIRNNEHNNGEYLALIEEKIEKYRSTSCPGCSYHCFSLPDKHEIGCRKGKCVDLRFYARKNL